MRVLSRQDEQGPSAIRFAPFAMETSGYMGTDAVQLVNCVGDNAAERGCIAKAVFVRWVRRMPVLVQRCSDET